MNGHEAIRPAAQFVPRPCRCRAVWRPSACAFVAAIFLFPALACAQSRDGEAGRKLVLEQRVGEIKADHPDVATITATALKEALPTGNFVLVDVRTEKERAVSTLPGAISEKVFEERLDELMAEGRTVVAYCTIGARSSSYARQMGKRGIKVLNLEGSVLAWTHARGDFVSDAGPTRRVHVYGRRWNLAADGYETVW